MSRAPYAEASVCLHNWKCAHLLSRIFQCVPVRDFSTTREKRLNKSFMPLPMKKGIEMQIERSRKEVGITPN